MISRTAGLRFGQRLLFWVGLGMLAYAGVAVAYADIYQRYQSWKFEQMSPASAAADLQDGDLVGRLEIPRVGISVMVLQGTEDRTLAIGAGHVPGTPIPGAQGNVAIAAHRDTFFRNLKEIQPGDNIQFSTVYRTYNYVVDSMETVNPDDTRVLETRDSSELTLITCFPFYFVGSAPKRFIVHAKPMK